MTEITEETRALVQSIGESIGHLMARLEVMADDEVLAELRMHRAMLESLAWDFIETPKDLENLQ